MFKTSILDRFIRITVRQTDWRHSLHNHFPIVFVLFAAISFAVLAEDPAFDKNNIASIREKAEQGDPVAQYYLGQFYEKDGKMSEAAKWYRKSAEQQMREAESARQGADRTKRTAGSLGEKTTIDLSGNVKLEMVLVEVAASAKSAGEGKNSDSRKDASQTKLTKVFFIGRTEVTQAQWQTVMKSNPSNFRGDDLPVERVDWSDAMYFCECLNKTGKPPGGWKFTLPTEAQWEYAAKGGRKSNGYRYSGGNNLSEVAWHSGNSQLKTHPVGQKKANELGLHDMTGNVSEWCLDDWNKDRSKQKAEFTRGYFDNGNLCVIRGGNWYVNVGGYRLTDRDCSSGGQNYIGFRVALVPVP